MAAKKPDPAPAPAPKTGAAATIAAGPGAGADTSTIKYLGVPSGYQAVRNIPRSEVDALSPYGEGPNAFNPIYAEGEQYAPGGGSPEDIARLQQQLDRSGLFSKSESYRLGVWDDNSVSAYTRLLYFANQQGYSADQAISRIGELTPAEYDQMYGKGAFARSSSPGKAGGLGGPGTSNATTPGAITQGMSTQDLSYLADRTARTTLGRKLTGDEMTHFTGAYQSMLNAAVSRQAAAQATAQAGTNATYAGPTDPAAFADQQLQATDPTAYGAHKQLDAFKTIAGALKGLGG